MKKGLPAGRPQSSVRVCLRAARIDTDLRISVADQGPGIPADVRAKIFNPFFTTKSRGTGLGLPTAKRLVDAHRGDLLVECPTGGGTRVVVRLPVDAE